MITEDPVVNWLLESGDPSICYLTITEILDKPSDSKEVLAAKRQIPSGPIVQTLLSGQRADGGFGVHPYQKWTGAHWRLVSIVVLGIPSGFRPAVKATDLVLKWLLGEAHVRNVPQVSGRYRRCASQEGNALAVCSRLGIAQDTRVQRLAESLEKAAEFFLRHRLFRSCRTDSLRQPETFHSKVYRSIHSFTELHYPLYWHYDIL